MSTTYPHHLYSHLHHPHQKMSKNKVPSVTSWTITLDQSAPPTNHHHHLQWYSIDLSLYLMCLHSLLKLHLQCSTLMIIIAPQMRHIFSQPGRSQLVTRRNGARKHSKNSFKICQIFLSFPHSTLYNQLSLLLRQKCKSTIDCATRTRAHAQLIASFPWTPARRAAYSHL